MSLRSVSYSKSKPPGQARAAGIDLGSLGQLSRPGWLDHSLSPYAAYGAIGSPAPYSFGCPADLATTYPLVQAAIQRPAQNRTALTLSAPIAGSGNLILAARRSSPAPNQRVQARTQTRPARQKPIYRHSWLRTATKSPAFALSSAAINGLMLVSPLVSFAQTTAIYGTGSNLVPPSNIYTSGTINSGVTVILNDGATVSGADQITLYGALQFNQTGPLTIENLITGIGILSLTNTGTLYLSGDKTYTGNTSINFGTLVVLGSLAGSNVSVDTGATFQVDGEATIGSITGNGTIKLNERSLTAGGSNSTTTFSGMMVQEGEEFR